MNKTHSRFILVILIPAAVGIIIGAISGSLMRHFYSASTDTTKKDMSSSVPLSESQPLQPHTPEAISAHVHPVPESLPESTHESKSAWPSSSTPLPARTQSVIEAPQPIPEPEPEITSSHTLDRQPPEIAPSSQQPPLDTKAHPASSDSHAFTQDSQTKNAQNKQTRTIVVKNGITRKMLGYSHWTGTYRPTTFVIDIDGNPLGQNEEQSVTIKNNRLTVSYRYSFMKGYRTGARNITFIVDPEATTVTLTFAWKDKWHILCDNASPESAEEIEFKE